MHVCLVSCGSFSMSHSANVLNFQSSQPQEKYFNCRTLRSTYSGIRLMRHRSILEKLIATVPHASTVMIVPPFLHPTKPFPRKTKLSTVFDIFWCRFSDGRFPHTRSPLHEVPERYRQESLKHRLDYKTKNQKCTRNNFLFVQSLASKKFVFLRICPTTTSTQRL